MKIGLLILYFKSVDMVNFSWNPKLSTQKFHDIVLLLRYENLLWLVTATALIWLVIYPPRVSLLSPGVLSWFSRAPWKPRQNGEVNDGLVKLLFVKTFSCLLVAWKIGNNPHTTTENEAILFNFFLARQDSVWFLDRKSDMISCSH